MLSWIADRISKNGVMIRNIGYIESHPITLRHMRHSRCLTFPLWWSLSDSHYWRRSVLPAHHCCELDYLRNLVDP